MLIRLDNGKTINVVEKCLTVRNGKLFNTDTNRFEGIDGDKVDFYINDKMGDKCWIRGTVDTYTCNRRIKLQGVNDLYAAVDGTVKTFEHKTAIVSADGVIATMDEEWETVLSE